MRTTFRKTHENWWNIVDTPNHSLKHLTKVDAWDGDDGDDGDDGRDKLIVENCEYRPLPSILQHIHESISSECSF